MEYIYSRSYYGIFVALHLKSMGNRIAVLTPSDDLRHFCADVGLPVIPIENFPRDKIGEFRKDVLGEINRIISLIKPSILHFSHRQFDLFCFLLVNEYSRHAEVIFHEVEYRYDPEPLAFNPRMLLTFLKYKKIQAHIRRVFGISFPVIRKGNVFCFALHDTFFSKKRISFFKYNQSFDEIKQTLIAENQIPVNPYFNMFISQNLTGLGKIITKESLSTVYSLLKDNDVVFKLHPNMCELAVSDAPQMPTHIPAEFLFCNIRNCVISVHSEGLIAATRYSKRELKCVSVLRLVEWANPSFRDEIERWLTLRSNNRIVFPHELDDLRQLLKGSKN